MKYLSKRLGVASGLLSAFCGLFLATGSATATPVYGTVFFEGSFIPDARVFGSATRFVSFSDVTVTGGTGLYAGLESEEVSMDGFTFAGSPVLDVWDFTTLAGNIYSFDLSSVQIQSRSRSVLVLTGTGVANISGFDSGAGTWTLTANGNTRHFTAEFDPPFKAAAVPDGGATVGLLGLALLSVASFGRIIARKS